MKEREKRKKLKCYDKKRVKVAKRENGSDNENDDEGDGKE